MTWFEEGRPRGPGEAKGCGGWERLHQEGAGNRTRESCWGQYGRGGQDFCLYVCESMDRIVGECPEVSQSLGLDITCTEGTPGITEDEYFQSERGKRQP